MAAEEFWDIPLTWRRRSLAAKHEGSLRHQRQAEPVDPLTRLFRRRSDPSSYAPCWRPAVAAPGAAVLARAAAAFTARKGAPSFEMTDLLDVKAEVKKPEALQVKKQSPAAAMKSPRQERLSITAWAVSGFAGKPPESHTPELPKKPEGRLSFEMSKLRKKRNAFPGDLARKPVDPQEEVETDEDSHFVPLCIRKPEVEVSVAPRRSRKSSAKPRPSAALGGANRGLWLQSFKRYLYDGEIHADDLPKALLHSGFEDCRPHLISLVLTKVAEYNTLDEDEFLHFMSQYEEEQKEDAYLHFQKFAVNGQVELSALPAVLLALELNPRRRVLHQICQSEVVCGSQGPCNRLTFPQFQKLVEILRQRYSFLEEELEHFRSVFQVFDRDRSGGMSLAELSSAFAWLGFPISGSLCSLHQQHDLDDKGVLTEVEFLRCLRSLYEEEARIIKQHLSRHGGRCRTGSELEELLQLLGHTATVDILVDALQAHNLCKGYVRNSQLLGLPFASVEFSLDLEELRELTSTIRTRDGFTDEEMEEMKRAFTMQAKSEDEISTPAIQKALRWLGHMYSFEMVQNLVTELDIDGDCMLDFTLFVKLIRKCRDRDRQEVANAFFALDPLDCGFLDHQQQLQALESLGITELEIPQLTEGPIRLQQFLKIVQHIKFEPARLQQLRENDFFEARELLELQRHFRSFDKDASGELQQEELVMLIEALFPRHAHLRDFRPYFSELLAFADVNSSDSLDFKEFVRLIRKIRDHEEEFQFELYKETLQELGFSNKEASDIHLFFLEATNGSRLTFQEVKEMIAGSFNLNEKESQKLFVFCRSAVETTGDDPSKEEIHFLSFLHVMRKVLDAGWVSD